MELNSQVNIFTKGMNMDADISMIQEGQYRYAENIRLLTDSDGTSGILQNIEYIRQYSKGIPVNRIILGTAVAKWCDEDGNIQECGLVFTKHIGEAGEIDPNGATLEGKLINTLYKVLDFNSLNLTFVEVVKGLLEVTENVSIITNYESDKASNVYISDGLTSIKVINIQKEYDFIIDSKQLDLIPSSVLLPFKLVNTIQGSLPAGSIQYCYQLFNVHGGETTTAALSEVIPLTKYDTAGASKDVKGQTKGEISGKGCQLKAEFSNTGKYEKARIFSIIYLDNIAIPDIYIVNEVDIPQGNDFVELIYNDTGNSFLSKITIDEFNSLVPFEFNAKCIEKMGNRLYAANLQELTWDVEFDARAYRCSYSKDIILANSDATRTIVGRLNSDGTITSSGVTIDIAKDHDCINPSNVAVLEDAVYMYGYDSDGTLVKGGTGPNVSYKFIYTALNPSSTVTEEGSAAHDLYLNCSNPVSQLYYYYEGDDIYYDKKPIDLPSGGRAIIPNYADPYICSHFLGYQRDEIYRFGIIFYNDKGIPSPVHWIGDIRMPAISDVSSKDSFVYPFHIGEPYYSHNTSEPRELVAYALGIEFTIKSMPIEATAYEIVRCNRTDIDKTVVTQGIFGALYKFTDWSKHQYQFGENDTRPAPMFSLASVFRTVYYHGSDGPNWDDEHTAVPGYFEFVSPEICINRDTILQNIQDNNIVTLYKVDAQTISGYIGVPQSKIYTVADDGTVINNTFFGSYAERDGNIYFNGGVGPSSDATFTIDGVEYYSGAFHGYGGVYKYYNISRANKEVLKIDDAVISNLLPYKLALPDSKNYAQHIENKSYINTSIAGYRQYGAHGINAVLKVDDSFDPYKEPTAIVDFATAYIANIKQLTTAYGGNTYVSRQNSVYNSCGCFATDTRKPVMCYGGDTYLNVLDYLNTSMVQETNDVEENKQTRMCCINYIPLESQFNLNLRSDDSYHREANNGIGPNLIQHEPVVLPNGYVQKTPYYEYNVVYSATSGSKHYVPASIYAENKQVNNTRIAVSELKTNNELTDSWRKFKFANYLDVDTAYGQITNLKSFNNRLYYWQANAVGIAAVNERSLITDNNISQLTLGTGGILTRFDYIVTLNGSSIVNDKSITNSASTIYWYDFDKNEICALNSSGALPLSKTKGVQSYLNTLPMSAKKNAVSFYDKKYNEVWFRLYDKALIYNEQLQAFTSFYTHNPNWFFPFSDKLVTIKDNNMYYLHNIYEINSELKTERVAKIQFVVNKDISNTKVFDNVVFSADFMKRDDMQRITDSTLELPEVVNSIVFKTKTQETNPIDINSIDLREDNYRFAIPREKASDEALQQLSSQSYLGRMRGKYLICDYTFDCNNNREFKLPYIKTTYRYSML